MDSLLYVGGYFLHLLRVGIVDLVAKSHIALSFWKARDECGREGTLKAKHGHSDLAAWDSLLHGRGHFLCKHDHVGGIEVSSMSKDIVHLLLGSTSVYPIHQDLYQRKA